MPAAVGRRLLRATLLQPITHVPTLELRYACVEELGTDYDRLTELMGLLKRTPRDLDRYQGGVWMVTETYPYESKWEPWIDVLRVFA